MKKLLSIILTVCMIASLAATCMVSSGAALDASAYPNVKIFAGLTADQVKVGQGYAGGRTTNAVVTAQATHYDITTKINKTDVENFDEYVYVKLPAMAPGTTYKYMAYKYKLTADSLTCNDWLYVDGTHADGSAMGVGSVNSGWRKNEHIASGGTGKWTTVIIPLPAGLSQYAAGGTFDMNATLDSIRFGTPTTTAGKLSFAWAGIFESEAKISEFDTAFNAAYTLTNDGTVATKTEKDVAAQKVEDGSLKVGDVKYTIPHMITFDEDAYTSWVGKAASADAASPLRATWTARQTNESAKFAEETSGNNYLAVASFFTSYSDFRFANGEKFLYSADIRYSGTVNNFRGFLVNFGEENNTDTDAHKGSIFYDNNGINDDAKESYVGKSGCGIYLLKADTVRIFVYTVSDTGSLGVISNDVAITTSVANWANLKIYDDGAGTISFYLGTEYLGKITYSDAGLLPVEVSAYNERYYRKATIFGKDNTKVVSTDKAVISYTKSFGMGTRATSMDIDNLSIAEYTMPIEEVAVNLSSEKGKVGDTVTVALSLNTPEKTIAAVHTLVKYDTTKLSYKGFTDGTAFVLDDKYGAYAEEQESGTISLALANFVTEADGTYHVGNTAATGIVIYLKFEILSAAAAGDKIDLIMELPSTGAGATVFDENYTPIDRAPVFTNGSVTVEAAPAPTTPTKITLNNSATVTIDSTRTYIVLPSSTSATTYANFKAMFNDVDYLVIKNASGAEIESGRYIGTNFTVELVVNKTTLEKLTVYMVGDVDSNGKVTGTDATTLKRYLAQSYTIDGALKLAANAYADSRGYINAVDCTSILKFAQTGAF